MIGEGGGKKGGKGKKGKGKDKGKGRGKVMAILGGMKHLSPRPETIHGMSLRAIYSMEYGIPVRHHKL